MKKSLLNNSFITKLLASFFLFAIAILSIFNINVNASKLTERAESINELYQEDVQSGLTLYKQQIKTLNNGVTDPSDKNYKWNPHTVQWVDFSSKEGVKVVSFSGLNQDKWKQMTTRQAAQAYEKANPGWIVLAGINGDFFNNSGTPITFEPTGLFTQDGDMFRAEKSGVSYRGTLGFKDDGSYIIGDPSVSSSMYVRIFDEAKKDIVNELPISKANGSLSTTGITLITKDVKQEYDFTGYKVLVGKYDICRISMGGYVFVKGTIKEVKEDLNVSKPENGYFYLASCDGSLDNVELESYLKCEYKYTGDWENVTNASGYIHQVIDNGIPMHDESKDSFINTTHPRTLVGFKEDGSCVFMVVDGRGKESENRIGVTLSEAGELLKIAGCVEGYNCDGGGSSTLVVRNKYGSFNVINTPSDGSERSDGNHLLAVMRDPSFNVDTTGTIHNEITINLSAKNEQLFSKIKDLKLTLNGKTVDYNGSNIRFDGLTKETSYELTFTYKNVSPFVDVDKAKDSDYIEQQYTVLVETTDFNYPDFVVKYDNITKNSVEIVRDMTTPKVDTITNIVVHLGGKTYNMGTKDSIVIDSLLNGTSYNISYEYDVLDESDGTIYHVETGNDTISTLEFNLPVINNFSEKKKTDSSITFMYDYTDTDRVVKKAYILYNDVIVEVIGKEGEERVSKLDFANNDYSFKLVLEYAQGDIRGIVESSELVYTKPKEVIPPTIDKFEVSKEGLVSFEVTDESKAIETIALSVNGVLTVLDSLEDFTPSGLDLVNKDNTFILKITYIDTLGKALEVTSQPVTLKKTKKEAPVINLFTAVKENNTIKVNYQVTDTDNVITSSYIYINGEKKNSVNINDSLLTIEDVNFDDDVSIKLVIEYSAEEIKVLESSSITLEKNVNTSDSNQKKKCGKKTISIVLSFISVTTIIAFILKKKR